MKGLMNKGLLLLALATVAGISVAKDIPDLPEGMTMHDIRNPEPIPGFKAEHNAIESEKLRISMDKRMNGFVEGKVCDFCEEIKVTITPDTRAFENDKEVPLSKAAERLGRFATVIYEMKSKKVTEIRW